MICEKCKERPASVVITKGYMGESIEHHLCEKCAFQSEAFHFSPNEEPLSIQQFLSHWFGGGDTFQTQPKRRGTTAHQLECPDCKLTFGNFLDIGKFGCATCYETFKERLPHVFGKLHNGQTTHTGKIPVSFNELYAIKRKIEEVRVKMQEAVEAERFEEAAELRDEARMLQQHLSNGGEAYNVD
ncbi:UvrB/UvrC motif-containing protein [Sporosarcina pasteurii]|uniref:Uncharacterized protein with conserved CXXC pairs n=1 Tax=Sporosarcina pasteurii TaxID=1474 RepID=A0A380CJ69_SPOPA|nr:UvrB/UvrC motif-containing protein [Sporosarcina pasteurii]MDS9471973.1 UvrB/UvrC motif-containing protein [Sporosarcina pasteurii]QBQ06703.1 nucleotide excision repair protein [Sporosarcina pasteurii]SUJ21622.1 Uncharacterized protein with conserved CXXC pairs [Sporosarcina pasteurii]